MARRRAQLRRLRRGRPAARGFTLIEMMVVVAVLTIVAAIAFVGIGQNTWESDYRRFTDDLEGQIQRARNTAIDDQTEVWIDFTSTGYVVTWEVPDPASPDYLQPEVLYVEDLNVYKGGRLVANNDVCIRGFGKGIRAPSQVQASTIPGACVTGGAHTLRFYPTGEMRIEVPSEPANQQTWGGELYIADTRVPGKPYYTIIEIFPGGLIRKQDGVQP